MDSVTVVRNARWMAGVTVFLTVLSGALSQEASPSAGDAVEKWKAPVRKAKMANPVESTAESIDRGKKLYEANCLSCHGTGGKGDGKEAAKLTRPPGDLTKIGDQSDGAVFWKITTGRTPMPTYEKTFSDNERWDVINYARTLTKAAAK